VDLLDLHRRAVAEFGRRLDEVGDDQWSLSTPCTDWDVRDLVNHVAGENAWVRPMLEEQTIEEVGGRLDGDILGADPRAAWKEYSSEALAAADRPGALQATVHASFGDISGEDYLTQVTSDYAIHMWDLARAVGGDEKVDPELVDFAYEYFNKVAELYRAGAAFGDQVQVPADADTQTKLLALTGRRA
jgi:uncharacterized protein (TIGR03086 family)